MSPSKVSTIKWDEFHNIVNGRPRDSQSKKHHGINPSTGEQLWPVPIGSQQDVNDAVDAAQTAFESWSETSLEERRDYLRKFKDHYLSFADEMIDLLCQETGKPVLPAPSLSRAKWM